MKSRVLIALFAIWAGAGFPTPMSVQVKTCKVRATRSQLGKVVATVSYGDIIEAGAPVKGWYPVTTKDGKKGYLHESALSKKRLTMAAGTVDASASVSSDEVALAGKGFTEQVEAKLKAEGKLDFTWVDRMATFMVSEEQIRKFRTEGNLPGGAQ